MPGLEGGTAYSKIDEMKDGDAMLVFKKSGVICDTRLWSLFESYDKKEYLGEVLRHSISRTNMFMCHRNLTFVGRIINNSTILKDIDDFKIKIDLILKELKENDLMANLYFKEIEQLYYQLFHVMAICSFKKEIKNEPTISTESNS